jgi:hypothetical protein
MAVERRELEQLAHKVHRLQHQDLADSWHACSHLVCAQLRHWLGLLPDDREALPSANGLATPPAHQTIARIRRGYAHAGDEVARAQTLWNRSTALLEQARLTVEAARQAQPRQGSR